MTLPTSLYIGSDHAGFEMKTWVVAMLASEFPQWKVTDCGPQTEASTDYPKYASIVGTKVVENAAFGILICGSGIGISIAANKVKGVRAALSWDVTSARLSRQHNDANILCLGARLLGREVAFDIIRRFLTTPFEGGRHAERVALIHKLE